MAASMLQLHVPKIVTEKSRLLIKTFGFDYPFSAILCITIGQVISKIYYLWVDDERKKSIWEKQYEYVYNFFGGNEFYLIFLGAVFVHLIAFWTIVPVFTIMDLTEKPAFLFRYKIKHKDYKRITVAEIVHLSKQCLFNQTVLAFPYACCLYFLLKWRGNSFSTDEIPDYTTVIIQMYIHLSLLEIIFYYIHRLLHVPIFYNYIHKRHHEWKSPVALTSFYFHPVDVLLSVYFPLTICMMVTRCHVNVVYLWIYVAITIGVSEHIGYNFPFTTSPERHTLHHQKIKALYGVSRVFDLLHGTDGLKKTAR